MARSSEIEKVKNYRMACEMQRDNSDMTWSYVINKCHTSYRYPYIDPYKILYLSDKVLSAMITTVNLIDKNEDIALAFKDIITKRYGLVDLRDTTSVDSVLDVSYLSDDSLLKEIKRRGYSGNITRKIQRVVIDEETIDL